MIIYFVSLFSAPSPPVNITMDSIPGSHNQLAVRWAPPYQKNGIITGYTVYCNTSGSQVYPEQVIGPNRPTIRSVVNGTTLAVVIGTGLYIFTNYECFITANTSAGEGRASYVVNVRTEGRGWYLIAVHYSTLIPRDLHMFMYLSIGSIFGWIISLLHACPKKFCCC